MAFSFRKFLSGIRLVPKSSSTADSKGDLEVIDSTNKLNYHNGSSASPVVTEAHSSEGANRLQNKDLDASNVDIVDPSDTTKQVDFNIAGATTGTTTTLDFNQTVSRTITFPDADTTLIGADTSNNLTNKTLDDASVYFVDTGDNTKTIRFDAAGNSANADTTIASTSTGDATLSLPPATDTLVGRISTDTGTNRLQNKELSDNNVLFVDSGDTTKKLAFDASGITTGNTRTLTAPDANTTIVGTDATQVITNKDIDGGTAANDHRITLPKNTSANLSSLTRKEATIAYDTDKDTIVADNGAALFDMIKGSASPGATGEAITHGTAVSNGNLQFKKLIAGSNVTLTPSTDAITISSTGGGGGGGGGGTDHLRQLNDKEAGQLVSEPNNSFIDTFKTERGTLTNTEIANSNLRLSGSNLTGNYERTKETNTVFSTTSGIIKTVQKTFKPKNTAASPSSTAATVSFVFTGDITAYFPTSSRLIIFKEVDSDGEKNHVFVTTSTELIARLTVSSSSYNSSLDETTVAISNPDLLDLDLNISSANYNTNLRFRPFDHDFQVKANTGDTYENMDITDESSIYDPRTIAIPGETGLIDLSGLTKSARVMAANISQNGQYAVAAVMEHDATTQLWHFYYSKNPSNPNSWTKFATTKSVGSGAVTENNNQQLEWYSSKYMFVSNDGQAFICYNYFNGSGGWEIRAVYSDLTQVTPTLSDTASSGSGAGIVVTLGSTNAFVYEVAGDINDGSLISVWGTNGATGGIFAVVYTAGGATYSQTATSIFTGVVTTPARAFVVGTSPNRRHIIVARNTSNQLYYVRYNEGNLTGVTPAADNSTLITNPGTSLAVTCGYGNNFVLVETPNDSAADHRIFKITNTETGTESLSSSKTLLPASGPSITTDGFVGESDSSGADNFNKVTNRRLVVDPADPAHVFFTMDVANLPDQTACSWLWEFEDIDSFVGIEISQYNRTDSVALRDTSTRTEIGQTLTLASTVFKTAIIPLYQVGDIASGSQLWVELWSNTAGVPTTLVDTSQSIDPSKLTRSTTGKWIPFYFNTGHNLTGDYTLILRGDYTISASNYIRWIGQSVGSYAGGKIITYNGSTWDTASLAAWDFAFIVYGEWVQEVGHSLDSTISPFHMGENDQEATIVLQNSSTIQLTYKRAPKHVSTVTPYVGHYFKRSISIGSGGTKSTLTDSKVYGYGSTYDINMVFGTALGDAAHQRRSITTGALDTSKAAEDRSGFSRNASSYDNIDATNITSDTDFFWNTSYSFNGTNEDISYADSVLKDFDFREPFAIELECKPDTITGDDDIMSDHPDGAPGGFIIRRTGSALLFRITNTSDTVIARIESTTGLFSIGQYMKIQIKYDGLGGQVRAFYSTDKNLPATTEITYNGAQTVNFSTGSSGSAHPLYIGVGPAGGRYYGGQLGYIKWIMGSDTFASEGYYPQAAMNIGQNLGNSLVAWKRVGNSDHNLGVSFLEPFVASSNDGELALADSYYQLFKVSKDLAVSGKEMLFKLLADRATANDEVLFDGINIQFNK